MLLCEALKKEIEEGQHREKEDEAFWKKHGQEYQLQKQNPKQIVSKISTWQAIVRSERSGGKRGKGISTRRRKAKVRA